MKKLLIGLVLIFIAILLPIVCDGDATASVVFTILGLYTLFGKDTVY